MLMMRSASLERRILCVYVFVATGCVLREEVVPFYLKNEDSSGNTGDIETSPHHLHETRKGETCCRFWHVVMTSLS